MVQGAGGGALVPLSMALASHLFGGRSRAAALGVEGAATFVGMAVGPAYGAWVLLNVRLPLPGIDLEAWQWIFFLNVPAGILTLLMIYVVAGGIETPRAARPHRPARRGADQRGPADRASERWRRPGSAAGRDPLILGGFAGGSRQPAGLRAAGAAAARRR